MAGSLILNSFYDFIEPIRIDARDWRYDVTQKFGGSIVAQLIGGKPIYLNEGESIPQKLFVTIGETVSEIHEDGIGSHKYYPTAIKFDTGYFIDRVFGSEYRCQMKDLARVQYVAGRNVFDEYFTQAVSDFGRHADRLLLGTLSGYAPKIEDGIDINSKTIDWISREAKLVKLPFTRYVPLDFDRFEIPDPHFTNNGWRKEGLTISKLEAVYTELSKYSIRGQILLFVGQSALVSLENQRVLTSSDYATTMGLTVTPNNISPVQRVMPTVYSYRGGAITIIGLPDKNMPDPVSVYHSIEGEGDIDMIGGKAREVNDNPRAQNNITYGYAMITNDVSMSWGIIGNIINDGLSSWKDVLIGRGDVEKAQNLVPTGFRPRYIPDDIEEVLRIRMSQRLFASRNRPETIVIVELAANPMIDIISPNEHKPIFVKNEEGDSLSVEVVNEKLTVVNDNN